MPVAARYEVTGMTCDHCAAAVTGVLSKLPGVREVSVDLTTKVVEVTSDAPLPPAQVRGALDEAGYVLAGADG